MSNESEDEMSNFALLNKHNNLAERLHKVEMATIYKVGFWGFVLKYLGSLFGLFKFMGF